MQKSRLMLTLLLLPALAFGPIGCGAEAIPMIVTTCLVVGIVAVTIHEIQEVESASLDIEMKRLRLQGMQDGMPVTVERRLTDDEVQQINRDDQVRVNGRVVRVSRY